MSTLHPREKCVNNIISFTEQYVTPELFELRIQSDLSKQCTIWTKFLEYLKPPKQDEVGVHVYPSPYIDGHATSLCDFVKGGKRYVWYHNPWGFSPDRRYVLDPEDIDDHEIEIIFSHFRRTSVEDNPDMEFLGRHLNPTTKLYINCMRLQILQKRDFEHKIRDKVTAWQGKNDRHVNSFHIMSALYTLKCLTNNSDHLEVIHPQDSMLPIGPQTSDGLSPLFQEHSFIPTVSEIGACTLWTSLYNAKVLSTIGDDLRKRRNISYILETIRKRLTNNFLDGEKTVRLALAKFTSNDSRGYIEQDRKQVLKEVYTFVYQLIPRNDDSRLQEVGTRMKSKNPLWTSWHRKVFREIDNILNKVVDKTISDFNKDPRILKDGLNTFVSAGFLEIFRILAERKGQIYMSVPMTKLILTMVNKINKLGLNSYRRLCSFASGVTALILCKHEEEKDFVLPADDPYVVPFTRKRLLDSVNDLRVYESIFSGKKAKYS